MIDATTREIYRLARELLSPGLGMPSNEVLRIVDLVLFLDLLT